VSVPNPAFSAAADNALVALFVLLLIVPPLFGLLGRRWIAVVVPLLAWPIYYVGLNQRWWGVNGTGDGWQVLAVLATIGGILTTAAAVGFGRYFTARLAKPR
jgi:hypothetical protein